MHAIFLVLRRREWHCWNSIGFNGELAATKTVEIFTGELRQLDELAWVPMGYDLVCLMRACSTIELIENIVRRFVEIQTKARFAEE
jgi:hypothetical protein